MRAALRLLASVQRSSQFLEAGAPTGLTGLLTHAAPRSTLLYLYSTTLETLKQFPEGSVYRQSTEALTKHRMGIIESVRPEGLQDWQTRVQKTLDQYPQAFKKVPLSTSPGEQDFNIVWKEGAIQASKKEEWDGEIVGRPELEGPRTEEERKNQWAKLSRDPIGESLVLPEIEPEPLLTADQINELETKIGAGLIEEVIQVAEGEKQLAETLLESQV